ncbi:MAG: DUF262 domain-containing protein, partial [Gammaproteobacteria bacterium]|nr:DUF262 domain-containing protein [Gammaproteobacteria bacterium]
YIKTGANYPDFKAIIDGQQRLTSLYIGLCGTYAYKQPRVWWPSTMDENILPPRRLYLDLAQPLFSDDDSLNQYNFRFLTETQYQDSLAESKEHYWFCCHKILEFEQVDGASNVWNKVIKPYLERSGLSDNEFAEQTLCRLYDVVRTEKIIHYFNITDQNIDQVLDIFIRTNSGGTKLEFSDLLTSIAVANWKGDFRLEIENLTKYIQQSDMGFYIERNWVLKSCLMLTDADVRFKVKNFNAEQVKKIQSEWQKIKDCIKETFLLVRRLGINQQSLISKNAVIPVCYYLYKKTKNGRPLYHDINNLAMYSEQRLEIGRWFYMALLKGVFGGQADTTLTSMRDVLKENFQKTEFPLEEIIERYKTTNKDLRFDDDYIENLLDIQHGEGRCRALLHLLFPEMNPTEIFHIDHLHPKSAFEKKSLEKHGFLKDDEALHEFFSDAKHWNSIANLHLLNDSQNLSKTDKTLSNWLNDSNLTAKDLLVEGIGLEFEAFKQFYKHRRSNLKEGLISRIFMPSALPTTPIEDSDEEVVEDENALNFR